MDEGQLAGAGAVLATFRNGSPAEVTAPRRAET